MYNITLISTAHSEIGKCNSGELHKIIESISPEVIFEEQSSNTFDIFYKGNQINNEPPEVKSIKKYLETHDIKHIPVDIDPNPNLSTSQIEFMFNTFKKFQEYRKLEEEQNFLTSQHGFSFLNSQKCSEIFYMKRILEKDLLNFIMNKELLSSISKSFYEEQDNRECEMLRGIYNYSAANQYSQAAFLIGSAHRKSIMQKISENESKETIKLNWTFYEN